MINTLRVFLIMLLLIVSGYIYAQTPNEPTRVTATAVTVPAAYTNTTTNYIRTWVPNKPLTDATAVSATSTTISEVTQTTQYFDGLARPL